MESRYAPRRMELDVLINVLVKEHEQMKEGLRRAKVAADRHDLEAVVRTLKEIEPVFRQHIADEESQILRLLIQELGVEGAEDEIKVFRQHRPIHQLMQTVAELASKSPGELGADQAKLDALFEEHTVAEEGRVFPRAVSCYRGRRR